MKMNKQKLAKHHFWILLGAFGLIALMLLIVIPITVGGMIAEKEKAIETMSKGLDGKKNPKTKGQIAILGDHTKTLGDRRETLHKEMFNRQGDLLTFPPELAALDKLEFGAEIDRKDRSAYIQEGVYAREYEEMAGILKQTEFGGGWKAILSPVEWSTNVFPQTEEVWLSLEDLCVRREVLRILQEANMSVARFAPTTPLASSGKLPLQRSFRSRLWELDLVLDKKDRDYVFNGKLKNISGKRQSIYRLDLDVWVSLDPSTNERSRPVRLAIGQDALAAGQQLDIPETKVTINQIPSGLHRVEQNLNDRFVPIKQLKNLVLGKNAGHRLADKPIKMAKFSQTKEDPASSTVGAPDAASPMSNVPGMGGSAGGKPGMPGMGGMGGPGATEANDATPNRLSKSRYIELTDQVRRMPVAFVIVIDQSNINDVLIALSNSPRMRFQTTQTHLQRVYGITTGGSPAGSIGSNIGSGPGPGGPGSGDDIAGASGPGKPTSPLGTGSMSGPPRGMAGTGVAGPGVGPGVGVGTPGAPPAPTHSGGEVQHAGLVEFTIYGVANVYERPKDANSPTAVPPASAPTPAVPMNPTTPATPAAPTGPTNEKLPVTNPDKPASKADDKAPMKPAEKPMDKTPAEPGKPTGPMPKGPDPKDKKN